MLFAIAMALDALRRSRSTSNRAPALSWPLLLAGSLLVALIVQNALDGDLVWVVFDAVLLLLLVFYALSGRGKAA